MATIGTYGTGRYWVRWTSHDSDDVQTQYATRPENLVETYHMWSAVGDGVVTASRSVMDVIREPVLMVDCRSRPC